MVAALAAICIVLGPARAADRAMVWHVHDIKGYLFVDGEVDGTPGLFMIDTGTPFRVLLNRHYVQLGPGVTVAGTSTGSGQSLTIKSHGVGHRLSVEGHVFSASSGSAYKSAEPDEALSADFGFIEANITHRYLGMIGYGLLKDYYAVLDYQAGTLTLQSIDTSSAPPALPAGALSLPFRPTVKPMPPGQPFDLALGGYIFATTIDTGGEDEVEAPESALDSIEAVGRKTRQGTTASPGCTEPVEIAYGSAPLQLPALHKVVGDRFRISLSYRFLRNYRSLWDPVRGIVSFIRLPGISGASARPCA